MVKCPEGTCVEGFSLKGKNKDSSRVSKNTLPSWERSGNVHKTVLDKSHYYLQTSKGLSVLVGIWGPSSSVLSSE